MRVIVKIWNGKNDEDVIVDVNTELTTINLDFLVGIMESYLPQPAMKAEKVEQPDPHKMTEQW